MRPSTVDTGYRLQPTPLGNPVTSDAYFQRVLHGYLDPELVESVTPQLIKFGDDAVSDTVHAWIANSEKEEPYVKQYDVWGSRYPYDKLVTSEGWKRLGQWGARNGVVSLGYEPENGPFRRLVQHAFNYIFSASSGVRSCPVSMTSGAARLVMRHLPGLPDDHPFHEVFRKLIARDDAWVSSQWMTERPGGSDVRNSETVAVYSPLPSKSNKIGRIDEGDYLLSGFKWFTSAADCDMALILAKTESGELSLFLAPTRTTAVGEDGKPYERTNGARIHRMKNKMGTKELPTAEIELKDTRAWMIGPKDKGIATIALLLNVTRTHNFITALSCWRRAMHIAKAFAKARQVLDQPLWTFPMHLRLLSTMEVKHRGAMQLAFFTTSLLSFADYGFPELGAFAHLPLPEPGRPTEILLRTLTATTKAIICKVGTLALQECQEAMGGVGYLDDPDDPEFNISRLYRDTAANMTWEGTTNVLASEVVRHVLNNDHCDIIANWMRNAIGKIADSALKGALERSCSKFFKELAPLKDNIGAALADGRQQMFTLGWLISGVLLALDAQRDSEEIASEVAKRWVLRGEGGFGEPHQRKRKRYTLSPSPPACDGPEQHTPNTTGTTGLTAISDLDTTGLHQITGPATSPHSPISQNSQFHKAYEIPTVDRSYDGRSEYLGDQVPFTEPLHVSHTGLDPEHGLPHLDVRFLALRKAFDLPSRTMRESLIDAFMEHCHPWTPIVERRWLEETDQRRPPLLLLQAVFLAGSRVLSSPLVHTSSPEFYERARALFFHGHEKNTTLAIVAVCLLQWWNPTGPEKFSVNTSGFWVRIGVELAYQVGLHKEPADGPFKSFRRRLWWTLVVRDSIISVGTGRPRTIHLEDSTMKPPSLEDFAVQDIQAIRQRFEDALFRWAKQVPQQLQIVHQHNETCALAPYNFEARQLAVPYFVSLTLLHRTPKAQASAPTICLLASSYVVAIIEEFICRDQLRYLGPVFTFYALVTGLNQLTGFRYECLQEVAEHEFNVVKVALEELGKRWGSAHGALRGLIRAKEAVQQQPRYSRRPPILSPDEAIFFTDFGPELCKMWDVGFAGSTDRGHGSVIAARKDSQSWDFATTADGMSLQMQSPDLLQGPKASSSSRDPREASLADASAYGYEDLTQFEDPLVPAEGFWLFEDLELPGMFSDTFVP
ncbi:Acyl-CoA dehydrogenase [Purpureocillium lilacinum]|uniref:Acyl-CoA dehydrogenase n=1 Tax=Purpureocillium lilacinum TaxID=33203 RepID=A0A179GKJ4_PURLI|nr:Acyl-CoA dehydrogenase [Purpureocillium lilacinum]OAQ77920.1 Acyl-CoA dehydrogenase [Purpureocillium lilacinum]